MAPKGPTAREVRSLRNVSLFVQRKGGDAWHWIRACTKWPFLRNIAKSCTGPPRSGELCNECLAKERKQWRKAK